MNRFCRIPGSAAHPVIRIRPANFIPVALLSLGLLLASFTAAGAQARPKIVVFNFELIDTSQEGPAPDHPGRLGRLTAFLRDGLKEGGYEVIEARDSAVAADVPASLLSCNGCELDLGRRAGADFVVTGFIHKISTLILNIQITMRRVGSAGNDADNGGIVAIANADIRGDNERSWRRGVDWLLRHRIPTASPSDR